MQRGAFHPRHKLDRAGIADVEDKAIDDLVAEVAVSHLAALEAQRRFHLVALAEESDSHVLLRLIVVLIDRHGELDFLDDDDLLLLARGTVGFIFLVEVLTVILNLADWGDGIGRDLNQVEGTFAGHLKGFEGSHDAQLFAVLVDDADLACTNALVGADE